MIETKIALFIGAHNDDCEYGPGGLAYLLAQKGLQVSFLNVSCKIRKVLDERTRLLYAQQEIRAAQILGAGKTIIGDRDDGLYVGSYDDIAGIRDQIRAVRPDLIFIHWPKDNHLEHAAVSRSSFAAISLASVQSDADLNHTEVYAYEAGPYQTMVYFYPDFYINITAGMERVRESLSVFDQPSAQGAGLIAEKEVSARFRGHMAGWPYAEAYKILKFPNARGLPDLLLPALLRDDFRWAGNAQYAWGRQYFLD